jgi:hypothetical protein
MAEKPKEKPKAKSKPSKSKSIAGKGDNPRNCFSDDYRDNYDSITLPSGKNVTLNCCALIVAANTNNIINMFFMLILLPILHLTS